jgi:hypothetical protein
LLINLVGFYMLFYGISEIFARFALRRATQLRSSRANERGTSEAASATSDTGQHTVALEQPRIEVLERAVLGPLPRRFRRDVQICD